MRVAFVTDVHANLPALEAVLAHARAQGCDEVWNGGDCVGYGPQPQACVQRLREVSTLAVVGNYDQRMLQVPRKRARWTRTKHPLKVLAFTWAWDHLAPESRAYLRDLPQQVRRTIGPVTVLVNHASPVSIEEHLTARTPSARWRDLAAVVDADLVLSGHTHLPCRRQEGRTLFVNPGAVGRPEGGDPRAGYAVVDFTAAGHEVTLHRVPYDTAAVAAAVRENGLPEAFAQMFLRGMPLSDALSGIG